MDEWEMRIEAFHHQMDRLVGQKKTPELDREVQAAWASLALSHPARPPLRTWQQLWRRLRGG